MPDVDTLDTRSVSSLTPDRSAEEYAPRLLAYVRLPGRSRLYRAVHVPEHGDEDLVVVEHLTTDALGGPCWVPERQASVEDAVIRHALIGGDGVVIQSSEPTRLERLRRLVAWCEAHQVTEPIGVYPDDGEVQVGEADFERLAEGREVEVRPIGDGGRYTRRRTALIDGVTVLRLDDQRVSRTAATDAEILWDLLSLVLHDETPPLEVIECWGSERRVEAEAWAAAAHLAASDHDLEVPDRPAWLEWCEHCGVGADRSDAEGAPLCHSCASVALEAQRA